MRNKLSILTLIMCALSGCTLQEVQNWGETCPPRDFDQAKLEYIGTPACTEETPDQCDVSDMTVKDISIYFDAQYCPPEFKKCIQDIEGESYHCEREKDLVCVQGKICTDKDDKQFCLDPSYIKTCGATNCDDPEHNYGGQNCYELDKTSTCEKRGDSYACTVRDMILCDNSKIDPASDKTCGAHDCNLENFGGQDCTQYGKLGICAITDDENYECICNGDSILCHDTCIYPGKDANYCGAKGSCTSPDPTDSNFEGTNCTERNSFCSHGECICNYGDVMCTIPGENNDTPSCYYPGNSATCGVKLASDGTTCTFNSCSDNEDCREITINNFQCISRDCNLGEQQCIANGKSSCYAKDDPHHCGSCDNDCDDNKPIGAHTKGCIIAEGDNGTEATCVYECDPGYTNCSEDSIHCVDLNTNAANCKTCGHGCQGNEYCDTGECKVTTCNDNQCTLNTDGKVSCVSNDENCGRACLNCKKNIHPNAACKNDQCVIEFCNQDEHPIYNENGTIQRCERNSSTACAAHDITLGDPIVDCTKTLHDYKETGCNALGQCYIKECSTNFHFNKDNKTCSANSQTECGTSTSSTVKDCTQIPNNAGVKCQNSECFVTACQAGYHPDSTMRGCEVNTDTSCGTSRTNCTTLAHATAKCDTNAGKCVISACDATFHVNAAGTGCDPNTDTSCGTSAQNCTTIPNATAKCDVNAGKCVVSSCSGNYHIAAGNTGCVENTVTDCGPGNSTATHTCKTTGVSAATCENGTCKVTSCTSGNHINDNGTGCTANTNSSCGPTNGKGQNCQNNLAEKICKTQSGVCACSTDNSFVLNYDKTACVIPVCAGIPGVEEGSVLNKSWYNGNEENACNPTKCNSKYTQVSQGGEGKYFACLPKKAYFDCKSLGYTYSNGTNCIGRKDGTGSNSHAYCESNYRQYITACIHKDVCCGTRNSSMSGNRDFMCTNCLTSGQTCDVTNGVCK